MNFVSLVKRITTKSHKGFHKGTYAIEKMLMELKTIAMAK